MSRTLKVSNANPDDLKDVWVSCGTCGRHTKHRTVSEVYTSDDNGFDITVWVSYSVIQCQGCNTVGFCEAHSNSEDLEVHPLTGDTIYSVSRRCYPKRISGRSELADAHQLPHSIYIIYKETVEAIGNTQLILASAGIRAIVEAVCKERKAQGKGLQEQIDDLGRTGIVPPDGAKYLHSLRFMGNAAMHEVKVHSESELVTALDVAEHLLKGVYILPAITKNLPTK